MRVPNPFGKKLLIPLGAAAGAVAFWQVRSRRRAAEDRRFEEEIAEAVHEEDGEAQSEAPSEA